LMSGRALAPSPFRVAKSSIRVSNVAMSLLHEGSLASQALQKTMTARWRLKTPSGSSLRLVEVLVDVKPRRNLFGMKLVVTVCFAGTLPPSSSVSPPPPPADPMLRPGPDRQ
jgi:hypothetical protein